MFRFVSECADKVVRIETSINGRHTNKELLQGIYGIAEAVAKATNQTPKFIIEALLLYAGIVESNPDAIKKECVEIKLPKDIIDKL